MTKRKSSISDAGLDGLRIGRSKSARRDKEAAYTTQQKTAIAEFQAVTNADKTMAAKILKNHHWNVGVAANAFFGASHSAASASIRNNANKIFDKFRDSPNEEPDEIGPEGTSNMLGEMQIGLDDIGALIFSELVKSPSLGRVTREGFVDGCADTSVDSTAKIRNVVLQRRASLTADKALFKRVYNHTFVLALQGGQKALPPEIASEFWRMLFAEPGFTWHSAGTPWLEWWLEFINDCWKRAVNKDLWRQTLSFAEATMKDETLGFWSEDSSWPSVIDEFVTWVKTEKRNGGAAMTNGDAMEVE